MNAMSFVSAKRFVFRALLVLLVFTCLVAVDQPKTSYAMPYYLKKTIDTSLSTCNNTGNTIRGMSDVNVLGGMPDHITAIVNGVIKLDLPGSFANTATAVYPYIWGAGYAATPYPYTVKWIFTLYSLDGSQAIWKNIIEFTCAGLNQFTNVVVTNIDLTVSGADCVNFNDGRLNNCDAGQTAAVYCQPDGSIKILAIYKGQGYDALIVTPDELAKVPKNPDVNTLIKTGNGASLYRLHGGLLQVNRAEDGTGKNYHFIFADCVPS